MDVFSLVCSLVSFLAEWAKKRPQKCDRIIFQTDETYLILMNVLNGSICATLLLRLEPQQQPLFAMSPLLNSIFHFVLTLLCDPVLRHGWDVYVNRYVRLCTCDWSRYG